MSDELKIDIFMSLQGQIADIVDRLNVIEERLKVLESIEEGRISYMGSIFKKDRVGDFLRNFWKPDGENIDPNNEAKLKEEMKENGIDVDNVSISGSL